MDPNACLEEARQCARRIESECETPDDYQRLADLVLALDAWIRNGGFLPKDWTR